jgi:hypothetical protein
MAWELNGNSNTNPPSDFLGTSDDQPLAIKTNDLERLRIDTNGNVGIGTADPATKLHVLGPGGGAVVATVEQPAGSVNFVDLKSSQGGGNYGSDIRFVDSGVVNAEVKSTADNQLRFATSGVDRVTIDGNGNVGIGTSSPGRALDVEGPMVAANGASAFLVAADVGGSASFWTNATYNRSSPFTGWFRTLTMGNGNVGIGTTNPTLKLDVQGDFGHDGPTTLHLFGSRIGDTGAGILFLRSGGNVVAFDGGDNVGIGTRTPGFKLDVAGPAHASSFPSSSDERLKTNVAPISGALEKVGKIRGVSFDWNEQYAALGRSTHKRELGVLANEVQAVFPELVSTWGDEKYLAVDYGRLTAVLLEAVKELTSEIEALRGRIVTLEKPGQGGE